MPNPAREAQAQLDEWTEIAKKIVMERIANKQIVAGSMSNLQLLINEELADRFEPEIKDLIKRLENEKNVIQADIDSQNSQDIGALRQEDRDLPNALEDVIEELRKTLD